MNEEPWFAVKCIFLHADLKKRNNKNNYEERIVLINANTFEEAIQKAEMEAERYCSDLGKEVKYLKSCNAFHIGENKIGNLTEIFSLITVSELNADEYINAHYDTGGELAQ